MMKTFRWIGTLTLAFSMLCACTTAGTTSQPASASPVVDRIQKRGELIVGTTGDMPPLNMTTKNGGLIGIEPELANRIATAMGVKLTFRTMRFHQLLPALKAGKVDMVLSNMTMTGKRNLEVVFVGPYLISGKSVLTKLRTLALMQNPYQFNSPKTTLVALKGSTGQQFVKKTAPNAQLVTADDYTAAVKMVIDDKVDAFVADYPICVVSVFRYPTQQLTTLKKPLTHEPIGIAIEAGDPLLMNWLQNFLITMQGSGELEAIRDRYMKNASWLKLLP
jgi:polar amino acid transport system substrate-binding protein